MKTRTLVGLAAVAGLAMTAQAHTDTLTWTWSWVNVDANYPTQTVVPQEPGKVSPGEGVEFRGSFSFTPAIGTIRTSQATNLSGPVAGIARSQIDFHAGTDHRGNFMPPVVRSPPYPAGLLFFPNHILGITIGQFALSGMPLNFTATQFNNAARILWVPDQSDPTAYDDRMVDFWAVKSAVTTGTGAVLYLDVGTGPGNELYTSYNIEHDLGAMLQIHVIPSPASLALLGLGGLIAARRRRHKDLLALSGCDPDPPPSPGGGFSIGHGSARRCPKGSAS